MDCVTVGIGMRASVSCGDFTRKQEWPGFGHDGKGSRQVKPRRMVFSMWRPSGDSRSFDGIGPALR